MAGLTGYAVSFNRRHRRYGHLFQNRYKSILCQEDVYLKELIRLDIRFKLTYINYKFIRHTELRGSCKQN